MNDPTLIYGMLNTFCIMLQYCNPVTTKKGSAKLKVVHKEGICRKKSGAIGKVSSVIFFYESHSYIPM